MERMDKIAIHGYWDCSEIYDIGVNGDLVAVDKQLMLVVKYCDVDGGFFDGCSSDMVAVVVVVVGIVAVVVVDIDNVVVVGDGSCYCDKN